MSKNHKKLSTIIKETKKIITLYEQGKELLIVYPLVLDEDYRIKKTDWERRVLKSLSLKDKFFFNNLPFKKYVSFLEEKECLISEHLHMWRLELLYKIIISKFDQLDNLKHF